MIRRSVLRFGFHERTVFRMVSFKKPSVLVGATWTLALLILFSCSTNTEPIRITKGPYLQDVTRDGITVMWETSHPTSGSVFWGIGGELANEATTRLESKIHEIRLTGLRVRAEYDYRVRSDGVLSDVHSFTTAVEAGAPFRFAFYGDNKNGPINHERVANAIVETRPAFVIHNGDLVDSGSVAKQWDQLFFRPARRLMHSVPLYPVLGNHEKNARIYFDSFSLPGNERWYSFDFGNAHFVVLDSDVDELTEDGEQLEWLEQDLEASTAAWKFVNFHHPPFSASRDYHSSERLLRKNVLHPIFEPHGVDMVFSGHDHNYERTRPIGSPGGHAVTYVVAGNGGTPMHRAATREWTAFSQRVFGFVTVDIDGARAHLRGLDDHGAVIDELVVDKSDESSYAAYLGSALDFGAIDDPVEAARLWDSGDDLFDDDDYEAALPVLMAAYEADPTTIRAVAEIAVCLIELGRVDEAIEWAIRGTEILSQCPEPYEALVKAFRTVGNSTEALDWALRWAAIEPDTPDAREAMAKIHADRGDLEKAIEEMRRAVAILPSDAELHFDLGRLYERAGDAENALVSVVRGLYWFMDEDEEDRKDAELHRRALDRALARVD
jgi:3',5'-cyclic AMP phosphodiesterase CpdA